MLSQALELTSSDETSLEEQEDGLTFGRNLVVSRG
jgi:hypothetical protein